MADEQVTNGDEWEWTPKREAVALALAEGKSYRDVAKELTVGVTTITRWVKVPEFQQRIDDHHDAMIAEARRILRRNATRAATQVAILMEHGYPNHTVRLAAAKDVLDRIGLKPVEKHEQSGGLTIHIEYDDDTAH